jgi:ribonuclease E
MVHKKKILINAKYSEEKRVAIVEGDLLVDFYSEAAGKEHLKGNIYKGVVTRIEPGLQAAFVDFGPKKHGFLQLREIKKEFFQKKSEGKRLRIQDVMSKGHELIVQVEKDERDTKGATLTTFLSIPGRYIVMMPGQQRVGISRKIEAREDRERLKEIFNSLTLPKDMGFILRTACSDKTSEEFSNDLKYLTKLWTRIKSESKKAAAPTLIYKEQDIAVRTVRDYLTSDVHEVLIDDQEAFRKTKEFLRKTVPWRKINIVFYKDKTPIFSRYNIEEQIERIRDRYVHLPSRGYVVIDKTEALTSIDVNSGRSRKEENVESTALRTNLEAADEIARQLRLRDIGGLIVIDFIDMASSKNRREVENRLRDALSTDKAHSETTGISKFGLVELTRERMRTAYFEAIYKKCEVCGGEGVVSADEMIAVAALREMHAKASKEGLKGFTCRMPVESLNYLINWRRNEIAELEKDFGVKITLLADRHLFAGQFKIEIEKAEKSEKTEKEARADKGERQERIETAEGGRMHERSLRRGKGKRSQRRPRREQGAKAENAATKETGVTAQPETE